MLAGEIELVITSLAVFCRIKYSFFCVIVRSLPLKKYSCSYYIYHNALFTFHFFTINSSRLNLQGLSLILMVIQQETS